MIANLPSDQPRIGVALGSGSARGWAHIGVLRELHAMNIHPVVACGTSMGAVVAAAYAAGHLDSFERWARSLDRRAVLSLFDVSFNGGLIEAQRVLSYLREELPDVEITDLPVRFGAVATDLASGRERWIQEGPLQTALRASAALPGLVAPSLLDGRWVTDGGLVNPVPVSLCRALGAELVIAVDLNTTLLQERAPLAGEERAHLSESLEDIAQRLRRRLALPATPGPPRPSVFEVMTRSLAIMQLRITRSRMAGDPPDLIVTPRLSGFTWLEFDRADEIIEEGRRALRDALRASPLPGLRGRSGDDEPA